MLTEGAHHWVEFMVRDAQRTNNINDYTKLPKKTQHPLLCCRTQALCWLFPKQNSCIVDVSLREARNILKPASP